jgi:hypothetical protein
MDRREELIKEIRRKQLIAEIRRKQSGGGSAEKKPTVENQAKPDSYYIDKAIGAGKSVADWAQGFNLGESVPVVGPAVGKLADATSAAISAPFSEKTFGQIYEENQKRGREEDAAYAERFPISQGVKEVGGSLLLPGVKGLSAGPGAGVLAKTGTYAANVGLRAGEAGLESAADAYLRDQDAAQAGQTAAALSTGLSVAPKLLGGAAKGIAYATSGLKPSTIDAYRALPDARRYMSEEERAFQLAQDAQSIERAGKEAKVRADQSFRTKKEEAMAREAQELKGIKERQALKREETFAEASKKQRAAADTYAGSLKGARGKVSEGSSKAYDIAEQSDIALNLPALKAFLTAKMKDMQIRGVAPDDSNYKTIERYRGRLDEFGKKPLTGKESKQLISWLDREGEDAFANRATPGAYNTPEQKALMEIRGKIDESLKKDPAYAEAMVPVASQTRALNEARDYFGSTGDEAYKAMKKYRDAQNINKSQVLENYEKEFGGDLSRQLDEAEALRKTDFEKMFAPEVETVRSATSKQLEGLGDIRSRRRMEANRKIDLAKGYTTEQGAVQKLRRFGGDPEKNFFYGKQMEDLAREKGVDADTFTQMAKDNALINAMSGSYQRGSRNVNLGAISLGGLGNLIGGEKGGKIGQMVGGAWGGFFDLVGAKPAKILVDFIDQPTTSRLFQKLGPTKGEAIARVYNRMRDRGPQALAMTHKLYMQQDPEYRAAFEGEDE